MKLHTEIPLTLLTFIFLIAISAVSVNGIVRRCKTAMQCQALQSDEFDIESFCMDGVCKCSTYGRNIKCYLQNGAMNRQIYGPCPCAMPNSECKENHCICKAGFMPSRDMRRCILSAVDYEGPCELNDQCQVHDPFAICNRTSPELFPICTCRNGFVRVGDPGSCLQTIPFTYCNDDENCSKNQMSTCLSGRCVCRKRWVYDLGYTGCYRGAGYDWDCTVNGQCEEALGVHSVCKNYKCACRKSFVPTEIKKLDNSTTTLCRGPPILGHPCIEDKDCFRADHKKQMMSCFHGSCKCKYGYISKINSYCRNRGVSFSFNLHVLFFLIFLYISSFIRF